MVWRPATDKWRAYAGISGSRFQNVFNKAKSDKYYPVLTDVGLWGGKPRYAAIFHKNEPGKFSLRFGINDADATAEFNTSKANGLAPISASVVSVGGKRQHTVLYRKSNTGSWEIRSRMTSSEYNKAFQDNLDAGRLPRHIDVYRHAGKYWFAAVFSSRPKGEARGGHGLSDSGYQSEFNTATGKGFLIQAVAGYDGGSNRQYAAAWLKMPTVTTASATGIESTSAQSTRTQSTRVTPTQDSSRANSVSRTVAATTAVSANAGRSLTSPSAGKDDSWDQGGDPYSGEVARLKVRSVTLQRKR